METETETRTQRAVEKECRLVHRGHLQAVEEERRQTHKGHIRAQQTVEEKVGGRALLERRWAHRGHKRAQQVVEEERRLAH